MRTSYRFREAVIVPDAEPDAEPIAFSMQCAVCEQSGPVEKATGDAVAWAVRHLKANPEHFTYREIITRPYRVEPGAWL